MCTAKKLSYYAEYNTAISYADSKNMKYNYEQRTNYIPCWMAWFVAERAVDTASLILIC